MDTISTKKLVLDPARAVLLVIDVQKALFTRPSPIYKAGELIEHINALISKWRSAGGLILFIQHSNDKLLVKDTVGWAYHPEIDKTGADFVIHKTHGNAFEDTELKAVLDANGIDTLVVTGLVTHGCVRATAQGGLAFGYRVVLVSDGHSNYSKDALQIIEKWNHELGKQQAVLSAADQISVS